MTYFFEPFIHVCVCVFFTMESIQKNDDKRVNMIDLYVVKHV